MFVKYGGTDRFLNERNFLIENGIGHSTYIRLRLILKDGYLSYNELLSFSNAVNSWLKTCNEKDISLLSVDAYPKYYKPVYEIDFDIAKTTFEVIVNTD